MPTPHLSGAPAPAPAPFCVPNLYPLPLPQSLTPGQILSFTTTFSGASERWSQLLSGSGAVEVTY